MKKMSRMFGVVAGAAVVTLALFGAVAYGNPGDSVTPAAYTNLVNARTEAVVGLSGSFYKETTLMFTNCIALDENGTTQGLSEVTVEFRVGNTTTSTPYTATVYPVGGETNRWWASVTVPDLTGTISVQTKLTDENTNVFIYPLKRLTVIEPLD